MINVLPFVKTGIQLVSSAGVGVIVENGIASTTPYMANGLKKILVKIGSYAISGLIADKAYTYVGEQFDTLVEKAEEAIEFVKSKRK